MIRQPPPMEFLAEPLATLKRIQDEINRAFGSARYETAADYPPMNVWRNENGVLVTAEIPGVKLDDVELVAHQNTLTIRGRREALSGVGENGFHRRERTRGAFARTISLPFNVDSDHVKATAENGVLSIILPRPEADRPRRIVISRAQG